MGSKLSLNSKPNHLFHGLKIQIDLISYFLFKVPLFIINQHRIFADYMTSSTCLLWVKPSLWHHTLFLDQEEQNHLLQKIQSWNDTSYHKGTQKVSYQYSHDSYCVEELYENKVFIPIPFEINHTSPQHVLKCLDDMLCLSIRLRVECGATFNLGTKPAFEWFKKM